MLKDRVVDYNTAKLLSEKGFPQDDVEVRHFYTKPRCKMCGIDDKGRYYPRVNVPKQLYTIGYDAVVDIKNAFVAPTPQMVNEWLMNKKKVVVLPTPFENGWKVGVYNMKAQKFIVTSTKHYQTYNEAMDAGITLSLERIKNKKK